MNFVFFEGFGDFVPTFQPEMVRQMGNNSHSFLQYLMTFAQYFFYTETKVRNLLCIL